MQHPMFCCDGAELSLYRGTDELLLAALGARTCREGKVTTLVAACAFIGHGQRRGVRTLHLVLRRAA